MQEKNRERRARGGYGNGTFKYFFLAIGVMLLIFVSVYFFVKGRNEREAQEILESQHQQHQEIIEHRQNETEIPTGNYVGVLRNNNEVVIVARNTDELVAEIPGYVDGLMVSTLGAGLFEGSSVETVIIPESVSRIEDNCFKDCKSLKNVVLPDSLTYIGAHAFDGCESLSKLDLPYGVSEIGAGCFANCTNLSSIQIPPYLEILEEGVFRNSAIISAKVQTTFEIKQYAFADCPNLSVVTIGSTTKSIDDTAFVGSENVTICTTKNNAAWNYAVEHDLTVIEGKTR